MTPNPFYAESGAAVSGILGLLFLWMWWRHRDPGAQWFAAGLLLLCAIYVFDLRLQSGQPNVHRGGAVLGALALMAIGWGMAECFVVARRRWLWRGVVAAPALLGLLWMAVAALPRVALHLLASASFLSMALMVASTWRGQQRQGRVVVVVALLLHPVLLVVLLATGGEVYQLRYLMFVPISVLGAALFAMSLTDARSRVERELAARRGAEAELARVNASLEQQVAARTAELHEMIDSLHSFNRSVSHDLRGPLGGIAGVGRLAQQAIERGDAARAAAMLRAISEQAQHLATLVDDLLRLACVSDAVLERRPLSMAACACDALDQLRVAGTAGVGDVRIDDNALPEVRADGGLMRQVFVNLIGNAIKFTRGSASPDVHVELRHEDRETIVAVRDNGVGFDAARSGELFQPFRRLHGEQHPGSGVGLTIVRRIVERHGGRVWAEGRPGAGASFYFTLPD